MNAMRLRCLIALGVAAAAPLTASAKCSWEALCELTNVPGEYYFSFKSRVGPEAARRLLFANKELGTLGILILDVSHTADAVLIRIDRQRLDALRGARGPLLRFPQRDVVRSQLQSLLKDALRDIGRVGQLESNHYVYATGGADCSGVPEADPALSRVGVPREERGSIVRPESKVTVAVIDSGLRTELAAFAGKLWSNPLETVGSTTDNDGSLVPGDVHGASFASGTASGDVADSTPHGTMVAGIVAARLGERPLGIAQNAQIMTLRILDSSNRGTTWDAASAIAYATMRDVDIINMSWATPCDDSRLREALENAAGQNILLVASAGNSLPGSGVDDNNNDNCPMYPSSYRRIETIVSVGATSDDGCMSFDSRYGSETVHISAPGVNVITTDVDGTCPPFTGTSAAAPVVAGVAARMVPYTQGWEWKRRRQYLFDSGVASPSACAVPSVTRKTVNVGRATKAPVENIQLSGNPARSAQKVGVSWTPLFDSPACPQLDILLSTDNGATFQSTTPATTVATGTMGEVESQEIVMPPVAASTKAKLRLVCSGTQLATDSQPFDIVP